MTIREIANLGVNSVQASYGDNLRSLVLRIYSSDDDKYYKILTTLNNRVDWDHIEPGAEIFYIPQNRCNQINEIIGRK